MREIFYRPLHSVDARSLADVSEAAKSILERTLFKKGSVEILEIKFRYNGLILGCLYKDTGGVICDIGCTFRASLRAAVSDELVTHKGIRYVFDARPPV